MLWSKELFSISLAVLFATSIVESADQRKTIDFNRDIRPVLSDACFACHGPDTKQREADLRLDTREGAFAKLEDHYAIVPGKPQESELYLRIKSTDPDTRMPPAESHKNLTAQQIDNIKTWIEQGAHWQDHWSFINPKLPAVPSIKNSAGIKNPIDLFIRARLQQAGLSPSPEADRRTLVRRVTFDLTGLPPTPEEVHAFLQDKSANAYEKVVNRLLASPHYGEHMARFWLDAARYGDTHGLHLDNYREMWAYRDWVINAFNSNLPFDQFTIKQLAGDLLPNASLEDQIASGFNRCHVTTNEGGTIAEEVYVRNVIDRVSTTGTVFMGLTLGCAVCHEHKYDPINQSEFYQLFAFFNNIDGGPMDGNIKNHAPYVHVPSPEQQKEWDAILAKKSQTVTEQQKRMQQSTKVQQAWLNWQKQVVASGGKPYINQATPAGLKAHFPLDEQQETTIKNAANSKQQGKLTGKANWVDGKLGKALHVKTASTYVQFGNDVGYFTGKNQAISFGGWVYATHDAQSGVLLSKRRTTARKYGYELKLQGGHLTGIFSGYVEEALVVKTRRKILRKNQWQHLFLTFDGSNKANGIQLYVNGVPQALEIVKDLQSPNNKFFQKAALTLGSRNGAEPFTNGRLDEFQIYDRQLADNEVARLALANDVQLLLAKAEAKRTPSEKKKLEFYYFSQFDSVYYNLINKLSDLNQQEIALKDKLPTTLVFKERTQPRDAYFLKRGEYDNKGDKVIRKTPAMLPAMKKEWPVNRLGFAKWLVSKEHPLTSRVTVNRFWLQLFGTALVKTTEDFGSQGQPPSHPRLFDWLAVDFRNSGWDVKRLMKNIAMSATYRQSSRVTPKLLQRDPQNILLARGPRFRLDAEMIRDQALSVSGLLVSQLGGPSVKPPQPDGLWFAVGYSGSNTVRFKKDVGADKIYRRSLYTFLKRTAPSPQMGTFDAPSREECRVRRERTNTPLQALLLMNDPQYVEAARFAAQRALTEAGPSPEEKINFLFELATARMPLTNERKLLLTTFKEHLAEYQSDPESAKKLIAIGETPADAKMNVSQLAAWTMVANLIFNLDEVITKG